CATFSNRNIAALAVAPGLPLVVAALAGAERPSTVIACAAGFAILCGGLFATAARTSILGATIGVLWLATRGRIKAAIAGRRPLIAGSALACVMAAHVVAPNHQVSLLGKLHQSFGVDPSLTDRLEIWTVAIIKMFQHPGLGIGGREFEGAWAN